MRGVVVDIVLPANNNHPFVAWAARAHVRPLIESGCRIWFNPPPFDHTKLMTIDGRLVPDRQRQLGRAQPSPEFRNDG